MKGFIYAIKNKINNKYYIGQTMQKDVKLRWKNHINELNSHRHCNDYLQHAWDKYGKNNFEFFILFTIENKNFDCLQDQLNFLEIESIKKYSSMYYENGYNIKEGGRYSKLSEYSKMKISKANTGKTRSEESREKNRQAHLGKKWTQSQKDNLKKIRSKKQHPFKNKHHSQETKNKISKTLLQEKYVEFSKNDKFNILNLFYIEQMKLSEIAEYYNTTECYIKKIKNNVFDELNENDKQYYKNYIHNKNIEKKEKLKEINKKNKEKKKIELENYLNSISKKVIYDYKNNLTLKNIGEKYKISTKSIKQILIKNNIELRTSYSSIIFDLEQEKEIINFWVNKHYTLKEIGTIYNVSSNLIAKILKKNNININPNNKGKKIIFTAEEEFKIFKLVNKFGKSKTANKLNVSYSVITRIVNKYKGEKNE